MGDSRSKKYKSDGSTNDRPDDGVDPNAREMSEEDAGAAAKYYLSPQASRVEGGKKVVANSGAASPKAGAPVPKINFGTLQAVRAQPPAAAGEQNIVTVHVAGAPGFDNKGSRSESPRYESQSLYKGPDNSVRYDPKEEGILRPAPSLWSRLARCFSSAKVHPEQKAPQDNKQPPKPKF